ncbi:MAG: hypothetical protein ACK5WA_02880, partial [Alphaproteobacteria bacterium]
MTLNETVCDGQSAKNLDRSLDCSAHPTGTPSGCCPSSIASTNSAAPAVSVAAAPRRGNPLARRGTWQRLLALGDGRVGGVREHAIHAVAEHRRVQV